LNFHSQTKILPVLEKAKSVYKKWITIHKNIERTARFGIGTKIDNTLLLLLELLRKAVYTPIAKKIVLLEEASDKVDVIKFFLQLLWELHQISNSQYIWLETDMQDLGKIIGGWKKGLFNKTSATSAEERK